jgi:hypothetical protein
MEGDPMTRLLAITALTSAINCGSAIAQDELKHGNRDALLELTMTVMPTNAKTSDAVTTIIELPKESSGDGIPRTQGIEHSARGLDTADSAREDGRAFGEAAAAAARDNREAASRASHDVGNEPKPANPETPDRPDLPSR